jgi:hypothetical protein
MFYASKDLIEGLITMKNKIIVIAVLAMLNGCSVYKVFTQPGPADLTGIGVGTPRQEVISRLGAPKLVDTSATGNKQDIFEFQSGMHQASKTRAVLYAAADVFTLTLAEIVLWPMEMTFLDSATCNAIATYDTKYRIETWIVSNKKNSAQEC